MFCEVVQFTFEVLLYHRGLPPLFLGGTGTRRGNGVKWIRRNGGQAPKVTDWSHLES